MRLPWLVAVTAAGLAQIAKGQTPIPHSVVDPLNRAVAEMTRAEATVDNAIEVKKIAATATPPDSLVEVASNEMRAAFQAALTELDTYAKSRRQRGSIDAMRRFETVAKDFLARNERIAEKMGTVGGLVSEGNVTLDKSLLRRMSPAERDEFRKSLTPRADSIYLRSGVYSGTITRGTRAAVDLPCPYNPSKFLSHNTAGLPAKTLADRLLDLMIPAAHAATTVSDSRSFALGIGCYGTCHASLGLACAACVVSAGGAAAEAYQTFSSCRSRCGSCHWYSVWRCVCRAGCTAAFVATLA
jgi:hypothetical protein